MLEAFCKGQFSIAQSVLCLNALLAPFISRNEIFFIDVQRGSLVQPGQLGFPFCVFRLSLSIYAVVLSTRDTLKWWHLVNILRTENTSMIRAISSGDSVQSVKSLPEPMLNYNWLHSRKHRNFNANTEFFFKKLIWKCHLRNVSSSL